MKKQLSVTKRLVDYALGVKYETIPEQVVEAAKLHILDTIGCAIAGSVTRLGKSVFHMIEESDNKLDSTIIGDGRRTSCKDAAFINGTLANALDFEDDGPGHPGSTIVPSALAVGEKVNASGRDILTAIIAAYEIDGRIGLAIRPSKERYLKVWGVGVSQAFGSTVAAGSLLGLNRHEMLNAFGIAGASSPLPSAMKWGFDDRPLTWFKDGVAQAALSGVVGALLAKHGFLGCRNILDGEYGFWIMAGSDRCNFDIMVGGLGQKYSIMDVSFKPYSACRFTHSTLDAVSQIISEHEIEAKNIKQIVVKSIWDLTELFNDCEPKEIVDAEFSLPYTVTMVVFGIPPGPKWFYDEQMQDLNILEFAKKIRIEMDPEADRLFHESIDGQLPSTVEVTTLDGRLIRAYVPYPSGSPNNPITLDEIKDKFRSLASYVLDDIKTEKVIGMADKLERVDNINELTKILY